MSQHRFLSWGMLLLSVVGLGLLAGCTPPALFATAGSPTTVRLHEPADGQLVAVGHPVTITAIAEDLDGVDVVDFFIDGLLIDSQRPRPDIPQSHFVASTNRWLPDSARPYRLRVQALGKGPQPSIAQVEITLIASTAVAPAAVPLPPTLTPTPTITVVPVTDTPAPTATRAPTASPTPRTTPCTDRATFVQDVTIPPGANVSAGASFVKTWRVKNDGDCPWDANYKLVFVSGNRLGGETISLPNVAPGATVDLSLPLVAPTAPGAYAGFWRLQNPQGNSAFSPTLEVSITVPCTSPTIHFFEAVPTKIAPGQSSTLRWNVSGATDIRLFPGGEGGVLASGQLVVTPAVTTTYRLAASLGSCTVERTAEVAVQN